MRRAPALLLYEQLVKHASNTPSALVDKRLRFPDRRDIIGVMTAQALVAQTIERASHAVADALRTRSATGLARVEAQLREVATSEPELWRSALTSLADVCRATREIDEFRGLAAPTAGLEPESLPVRLLVEIHRGARVGNDELAELLGTDVWQVSRAGRRLRDLGFVTRARLGRVNVWDLTEAGREEVDRLRSARKTRRSR